MKASNNGCCKYCMVKVNVVIFVSCVIIFLNGAEVSANKLRRKGKVESRGVASVLSGYHLSSTCPEMCDCNTAKTTLRCDAKNLTIVPLIMAINVEMLNLSTNQIQNLTNNSFTNLERLQTLHLEYNQILFIHPLSFQHLCNLRFLYLQHNQLKDLDPTTFDNLPALSSLQLNDNAIDQIPFGLFKNSSQLQNLTLKGNSISSIHSSAFSNLTKLTALDLSNNPLRSLEPSLWLPLINLKTLSLSSANFSMVHPNILQYLTKIQDLDLSNTTLDAFNVSQLNTFKELKVVNFSGSSVTCDCNAVELKQWMDTFEDIDKFHTIKSVFCAQPNTLAGKSLYVIPVSNLTCVTASRVLESQLSPSTKKSESKELAYNPQAYDPMLGWYTAATLSTMLIAFLICIGLEKVKNKLVIARYKQRKQKRRRLRQNDSNISSPIQEDLDGTSGKEENTDNEVLDEEWQQDNSTDEPCGVITDSLIHTDTHNDSTVGPDDQPIMFLTHSSHNIKKPDKSTRKNQIVSDRKAYAVNKLKSNNDRMSKLASQKLNSFQAGVQEVIRPDTLLTVDTSQLDTIVKKTKPVKKNTEAKDFLKMHVIAVHPDCPIHNPQKSKAHDRENICESHV